MIFFKFYIGNLEYLLILSFVILRFIMPEQAYRLPIGYILYIISIDSIKLITL